MSTYRQTAPTTLYTVQCTQVHKKKIIWNIFDLWTLNEAGVDFKHAMMKCTVSKKGGYYRDNADWRRKLSSNHIVTSNRQFAD